MTNSVVGCMSFRFYTKQSIFSHGDSGNTHAEPATGQEVSKHFELSVTVKIFV